MFSSAFKIKSSVVTATALIASVSLVLGRPQVQARDWTDDFTDDFTSNLNANRNPFTIPSPSDFLPSSPDESSPSLTGFPNLGLTAPETLSAVPQAPELNDPFGSLGLSTDWTKTLTPPDDGASDVAMALPSVTPGPGKPMDFATEAVKRSVDSISNGYFTFGFFEVSSDQQSLVPALLSNDKDWNKFTQAVRKAPSSYVLHWTSRGMLLIFTHENNINGLTDSPSIILDTAFRDFLQFVEKRSGKIVDGKLVYDEQSLDDAISPYSKPRRVTDPFLPI